MALRNYLIEGGSCSGKTSVYKELKKRGYSAIDGDKELAYQGDPDTSVPTAEKKGIGAQQRNREKLCYNCMRQKSRFLRVV